MVLSIEKNLNSVQKNTEHIVPNENIIDIKPEK